MPAWSFFCFSGLQIPLPNLLSTAKTPSTQAKGSWEMSTPEKIAAAIARKEKGNAYFKAGRVGRAVRQWNQAEEIIK